VAESSDLSKIELSFTENINMANYVSAEIKSIIDKIIDLLQLEDHESKDQIINDLLENGRQALMKYKDDIVLEIFETEIDGQEGKLVDLLKNYFELQWETQHGTHENWFLVFLEQYKNGEKQQVYENVLARTAEYGNKYMKKCPILSVVLQLLFEGIDDDCLQTKSIFSELWFTIATEGINSLMKKDENTTTKFSDYIVGDIMNEQTNNTNSALFQALRLYNDKLLSQLLEQSKVKVNSDAKIMVLDAIAKDGLLKGIQILKPKTTGNLYKQLVANVTIYLEVQEKQYLNDRQIINDSPATEKKPETMPFSSDAVSKDEKGTQIFL